MAKLIELTEAAKILGISAEALTDMRSRNEIFGYRDGSTWKFKSEEVDRVKASLAPPSVGFGGGDDLDDLDINVGDDLVDADDNLPLSLDSIALDDDDADVIEPLDDDDSDSILVSEEELGKSDENTASTIIGEADDLLPQSSGTSDASTSDASTSDASTSDALAAESDVELTLENSGIVSGSDAISASDVLGDAELPPTASDTSNLNAIAGISDDDLKLSADSGSLDLGLEDAIEGGSRIEISDDAQASSSGFGSAIDLGLDDDELVLGSGSGSDITSGAGDSGINIANPSDSGLSLEDPLELSAGGSGIESLELGEDDGMIDDIGDIDSADDFMLEPVADGLDEESDSGSQVIALDSEEFDESGAAGLIGGETLDENVFEAAEGFGDGDGGFDEVGLAAAGATAAAGLGTAAAASDDAATYSVWNVLSLFCIMSLLGLTGVMMLDLINNIWSWDEPYSINSTLINAILGLMPG